MAEKIVVAELDINTEAFLKAAQNTKAVLNSLKKQNQELKKSGQESSQQFVKNEVAIKRLNAQYTEQKNVLVSLNSANTDFVKTSEAVNKAVNKNVVSIQEARNNNKELLKIRNQLNLQTKSGRQALTQINTKLDENNKFIKENSDAYSKQKLNIGNYQSALSGLNPTLSRNIGLLVQIRDGLRAQAAAMNTSTAATNTTSKSLKLFRLALISTGVGAIVVALGSLITFLTSTQKGIDAVTKVTTPLKVIFQSLIGVAEKVGEFLFDAFSNPKKAISDLWEAIKTNIVNRFTGLADTFGALGRVIKSTFELDFTAAKEALGDLGESITQTITGVDNLPDKIRKGAEATSEFLAEAIARGKEIRQLNIDIENAEIRLTRSRAESNRIIKEQNKIAEDTTKTLVEREEAAKRSIEESEKLLKQEEEILDLTIKKVKLEQQSNDSGRAGELELAELEAKRNEKATQQLELQTTQTNKLNIIRRQVAVERQKELDETTRKQEEAAEKQKELDEQELQRLQDFEQRKRDLQNEIALANAETDEERAILKAEQDLIKQEEEIERLQLNSEQKQELLALLTTQEEQIKQDIRDQFLTEQLKKELAANKKIIEVDKKQSKAREDVANLLTGALIGLLGDSLGAKLASIALSAGIEAGLVAIESASAQGKIAANVATANAKAIAANPFTLGQPFVAANTAQGAALIASTGTASKAAISKIISAAALKSFGTIATKSFYEGGQVPYGTGGRITGQNIPTQRGGDNILATVKSGEVILNEEQQARAGGSQFFKSIGVPGFQGGGVTGINTTPSPLTASLTNNFEQFAEVISEKINDIKIVAIEEEITGTQNNVAEIVAGANI